jgi:hypothetical protein
MAHEGWFAIGAAAWIISISGCKSGVTQTAQQEWALDDLTADQGFSFRIPEFDVPPGHEEQTCYFIRVPDVNNGNDLWVDRVLLAMNAGSHHMNVFRVKTLIGLRPQDGAPTKLGPYDATVIYGHDDYQHSPCWASANWADWPLVTNSQNSQADQPYTDWQLPAGVAMRFSPGEMLMLQTHYVNSALQQTLVGGKVGLNFYKTRLTAPIELGTLFATQQSIRICASNPNPTYSGTCRFPGEVTITAANGHFHSRGKEFRIYTWDGMTLAHPDESARFYTSDQWDHPVMARNIQRLDPNGGGIWWDCEYQWRAPLGGCDAVNAKDPQKQGDCCYTFGGNTDVGEHCNVFLYYYPKVNATDVFCN